MTEQQDEVKWHYFANARWAGLEKAGIERIYAIGDVQDMRALGDLLNELESRINTQARRIEELEAENQRLREVLVKIANGEYEPRDDDFALGNQCGCEVDYDRYVIYCPKHGPENAARALLSPSSKEVQG